MPIAALALIVVGYALAYSGISNLAKGGDGWGFFQSLIGKGDNNAIASGIDKIAGGGGSSGGGGGGSTPAPGGGDQGPNQKAPGQQVPRQQAPGQQVPQQTIPNGVTRA